MNLLLLQARAILQLGKAFLYFFYRSSFWTQSIRDLFNRLLIKQEVLNSVVLTERKKNYRTQQDKQNQHVASLHSTGKHHRYNKEALRKDFPKLQRRVQKLVIYIYFTQTRSA